MCGCVDARIAQAKASQNQVLRVSLAVLAVLAVLATPLTLNVATTILTTFSLMAALLKSISTGIMLTRSFNSPAMSLTKLNSQKT